MDDQGKMPTVVQDEVPLRLDQQRNVITDLEAAVDLLAAEIQSVMCPDEGNEEPVADVHNVTEVGSQIHAASRRIEAVTDRINSSRNRVEL